MNVEEHHAVAQFLYREARLLDERRWDEWLALFTADGMYWVPLTPAQTDPVNHASLFYENAMLREIRARRLEHARAYSQQPASRTVHVVGNITLETREDASSEIIARSTFHLLEWRKLEQRAFGGLYTHHLVREDDGYKIKLKRVDLINCEAPHEALQLFI
jgi:3-phenylpropionate/cinnamic acid dioxygenase small subunit